jgi:hypothetical protein
MTLLALTWCGPSELANPQGLDPERSTQSLQKQRENLAQRLTAASLHARQIAFQITAGQNLLRDDDFCSEIGSSGGQTRAACEDPDYGGAVGCCFTSVLGQELGVCRACQNQEGNCDAASQLCAQRYVLSMSTASLACEKLLSWTMSIS